jgi:hypothetical protein
MRIALAAVVFALLVIHGEKSETQTKPDARKPNQPPQQTVTVVNQQAPEREQGDHAQKPPSYLSRLFSPENLPNITLVIVAAVTAVFILGQAREMKAATEEMRKSTKAAMSSVNALVSAERPWLNTSAERGPGMLEYKFSVTNLGRTPALIIGAMTCRHSGPDLPEEPEYPEGMAGVEDLMNVSQNVRMLAPGEHWDFYTMDLTHYTKQFKEWELKAILNGESKFFFYGKIKYRDVFKPDALHETRFCYLYERDRRDEAFVIYGQHPGYNQYT